MLSGLIDSETISSSTSARLRKTAFKADDVAPGSPTSDRIRSSAFGRLTA